MSTESERRFPGDGTRNESATTTGTGADYDRYGAGTPETGRRPETDAERVGEPGAVSHGGERSADPDVVGSGGERRAGDEVEADRPSHAADRSDAVHANARAGESATDTQRGEPIDGTGVGNAVPSESRDSVPGAGVGPSAAPVAGDQPAPLFAEADFDRLRTQWREVQVTFVDDPGAAVARADDLVNDAIEQMIATYQQRKRELDERRGDTADTENLRQVLRGYRAFFDQLLSTGA
ncbi:hypothetical protein [Nocardia sputi]|uniref:hypothetical protein n=1 Tax=Nocardia sputi TaxID=2943705 RepID=UPI0020BE2374|nr:hypothetical protein [Nocardia sputi]